MAKIRCDRCGAEYGELFLLDGSLDATCIACGCEIKLRLHSTYEHMQEHFSWYIPVYTGEEID